MGNKVFSGDFLKVLLALKESIMKDIHCSELAIIKEVHTNNCNCSLLSNPEIKINAYKTKGTICRVGDIVLVAFSDNDFRSNLLKKDSNSQLQVIDSPIKHQLDYGIIISNLTIGLGGTNVKFIDDAINITNLSNLDLNRLSDQKLNELKESGLLTENALYMTPDVSEDDTKANVDASNLTNDNVASWQDKCSFERVETIYDMTSTDANLNWGYTGGIQNATVTSKDFSKYKKLIVYYCLKNKDAESSTFGRNNIIEIDLSKFIKFKYSTTNLIRYLNYAQSYTGGIIVKINENKTSFEVVITDGTSIETTSFVYKIEGVY